MTINASPETVKAVAEALQLAALLEDRTANPDKARIAAWAEQIEPHRLSKDDLLAGVRAFHNSGRERAMGVGDLIDAARMIRRDRAERETREELNARYDEPGPRVAAVLDAIAASLPPMLDDPKYARPSQRTDGKPNPLAIRCPWCHAPEHRPCRIPNVYGEASVTLREPHPSRVEAVTR